MINLDTKLLFARAKNYMPTWNWVINLLFVIHLVNYMYWISLTITRNIVCKNRSQQESPPAWTQEAYRPPRSHSKSLLFRGGGSLNKNFFPSLNMYQAKSGVKNFSLYQGGGVPWQKIFFLVWTCIKPNLVSKIFPFTRGGPSTKIFFPSLNMYQAKSGVKKFSLYWGGGSLYKKILPVWTCIKPNLVSKIFPFTETRYHPPRPETRYPPPDLRLGTPPHLNLDLGHPHLDLDLGCPPPGPGPGIPPTSTWTWDPPLPGPGTPPLGVDWQTENSTFPHPSDAGGN